MRQQRYPGAGIICQACGGGDLDVKDSRPSGNNVRRRRQCRNCGERVTTFETVLKKAPFSLAYLMHRTRGALAELSQVATEMEMLQKAIDASESHDRYRTQTPNHQSEPLERTPIPRGCE